MSGRVLDEKANVTSIPERRPQARGPVTSGADALPVDREGKGGAQAAVTVWRCRVCGYLCARAKPPEVCPICRVPADRFEPFKFG